MDISSKIRKRCPRIPPELILQIVGSIGEDKRTVSACSLISRDWAEPSRSFLFKEITHRTKTVCHRKYTADASYPLDPLDGLLKFLDSTPHLASYIRSLNLTLKRPPSHGASSTVSVATLRQVLSRIPRLQKLGLLYFPFETRNGPLDSPVMHSIEALTISGTSGVEGFQARSLDVENLYRLLGAFAEVGKLRLDQIPTFVVSDGNAAGLASHTTTRIHSLSLSDTKLLKFLLPLQGLASLQDLDIAGISHRQVPMVANILSRCKQSLRHLGFEINLKLFSDELDRLHDIRALASAPLPNLQSVAITLSAFGFHPHTYGIDPCYYFHIPASRFLSQLLMNFPHPVKRVTFRLKYNPIRRRLLKELLIEHVGRSRAEQDIKWLAWKALDDSLLAFSRKSSCQFTFTVANQSQMADPERRLLEEMLPQAFSSGLAIFRPSN